MPVAFPPKVQRSPVRDPARCYPANLQQSNGKTWHGEIAGRTLTHSMSIHLIHQPGLQHEDEAIDVWSLYCLRLCIVFNPTSH